MLEIEGKILEIDVDRITSLLEEMGAIRVFDGELDVIFYDFCDSRLRESGKRLRLRKMGDDAQFTFKQKISHEGVKIEDEYEVMTTSFDDMQKILEFIGMNKVRRYKKYRISYELEDAKFEIDTLMDGVPSILEIEAKDAESVYTWAEKLGYARGDVLSWSGSEVLRYYGIMPA